MFSDVEIKHLRAMARVSGIRLATLVYQRTIGRGLKK